MNELTNDDRAWAVKGVILPLEERLAEPVASSPALGRQTRTNSSRVAGEHLVGTGRRRGSARQRCRLKRGDHSIPRILLAVAEGAFMGLNISDRLLAGAGTSHGIRIAIKPAAALQTSAGTPWVPKAHTQSPVATPCDPEHEPTF